MGTRGLTKVIYKKQIMVAQYGQWDHYLAGQGETIQEFLKNLDRKTFLKNLMSSNWIDAKELENYETSVKPEYGELKTYEDESAYCNIVLAEFNRDTGAEILNLIQDAPRLLYDSSVFEQNMGFCEGVFTLDFDKNTVSFNDYRWTFEEFKNMNLTIVTKKIDKGSY